MRPFRWQVILGLALLLGTMPVVEAQRLRRDPHAGYNYPAGGQRGTTLEVTVGGQLLNNVTDVIISGDGVAATVGKYSRPITPKQLNTLVPKLQEVRKLLEAESRSRKMRGRRGNMTRFMEIARETGVTDEELKMLADFRESRNDPKRQLNPQIAESVALNLRLAPDAEPGRRELRLVAPSGVSNPISFYVGQLREYREKEPNDRSAGRGIPGELPVIINGQILPGDVDRFSFRATRGEGIVVTARARELIPYLADAVPGWFQATLALYDEEGNELAYADDYRFQPDPVIFCEIPENGMYTLEIRDSIYRGREDFVYRITMGELPFITDVFPMGGPAGVQTDLELKGWNLPVETVAVRSDDGSKGMLSFPIEGVEGIFTVPFAVDTLPEALERESNDGRTDAQPVTSPVIMNGRIDRTGDMDVFRIEGSAGEVILAEVFARRLNSPLDSVLFLTEPDGRRLAVNDDYEDKGAGLITHHADSRLQVALPADGTYYLHIADAQHKGGSEYAYRLHIRPPRPDFELRVVPSSINARSGMTVPVTVYALRRDGFSDDIALELRGAPSGFRISGGWVPANQEKVRFTLTVPATKDSGPVKLSLEGRALIQGREVRRAAVPADDMIQAFAYHHLVPAADWMVAVAAGGRSRGRLRLLGQQPVRLPAGGTARVQFNIPRRLMDQIQLKLNDPPEGIVIDEISPGRSSVSIQFRADGEKIKTGLKGNLIIDIFTEREMRSRDGKSPTNKRLIPLGSLPAVPFVVGPRGECQINGRF